MVDIIHIRIHVAGKEVSNPFEYCNIVTITIHKTPPGSCAGLIFSSRTCEN